MEHQGLRFPNLKFVYRWLIKELTKLLHVGVVAKHHYTVAGLNLCATRNEDANAFANQSANGYSPWQTQLEHAFLGDFRTLLGRELGHVGIGHREKTHVTYVGIEHHLVDVACGNVFLIYDGTDVKTIV